MNAYHIWYADENLVVRYEFVWCDKNKYEEKLKEEKIKYHSILVAQLAI